MTNAKYIKITPECYLNPTEIVSISDCMDDYLKLKRPVITYKGDREPRAMVITKNGFIYLSPTKTETLVRDWEGFLPDFS